MPLHQVAVDECGIRELGRKGAVFVDREVPELVACNQRFFRIPESGTSNSRKLVRFAILQLADDDGLGRISNVERRAGNECLVRGEVGHIGHQHRPCG